MDICLALTLVPGDEMNRRLLTVLVSGLSVFLSAYAYAQQKPASVVIDVSPKFGRYDAYIHKMVNTVKSQWSRILIDSNASPPSGTFVAVKFSMDSKGHISKILDVGSSSSGPGEQICLTAVTLTAPFGEWTNEMVSALGTSQEVTIRFYY
jgi:hypothetical protein